MNHKEALNLLELSGTPSEKDINKAFRVKSKELHPDINPNPAAHEKFKSLSQAKQILLDPPVERQETGWGNIEDILRQRGFGGFQGAFHPFMGLDDEEEGIENPPIEVSSTVSFKESILGCKRRIVYDRFLACDDCRGVGEFIKDKCSACGGSGRVSKHFKQGNQTFLQQSPCKDCKGKGGVKERCSVCKGKGTHLHHQELDVTIPPGVQNGNVLNLAGGGNWSPRHNGFTSVFLKLSVEPHASIWREGADVFSKVPVTLLEALEGTSKQVEGVEGDEHIKIPPLSRNRDHIVIPTGGVGRKGNHNVIVDIDYGEDAAKVIEALKKKPEDIPFSKREETPIKRFHDKKMSRKQRKRMKLKGS